MKVLKLEFSKYMYGLTKVFIAKNIPSLEILIDKEKGNTLYCTVSSDNPLDFYKLGVFISSAMLIQLNAQKVKVSASEG